MSPRPPGPSFRLWSTAQVITRPLECMPRWFERYGDPLFIPTVNGDVVMTARPELVKRIFAQPPSTYSPFGAQGTAAITGPRSVFQLRDREHRRHRRLLMPPFHGSRMRAYAEAMQHTAREVLGQAADAGPVVLHELTKRISLEVILRTVFGVQQPDQVREHAERITAMVDATSPLFLFMPFMQRELWGLGPYARFRRAWDQLDAMLQAQLERAREQGEGQDVLSMLVHARDEDGGGLDDQEIRDELRTLLFAGHETTAIALCWAVDAIGRHPAVAERLGDELHELGPAADPEEIAKVGYLDAVCSESLRLYPIVTEVLRHLHEPLELGGYELQPPTAVSASILGVHMREDLYPQAADFRPERFLERKYGPHEFLPFGGGHRRCVGAAFASFELRIVVGTLLREFGVALQDPVAPRAVRRNVTMAPRGGVPVTITRARPGTVRAAA
ncbi:MAG: cytochrome P450 [Myxococcales bacterium]|nr:cytochrome P450 [Myxococcales bacterium]MCB9717246.1 cytochrome P450 [Myxococcales bacterium]